MPFSRSIAGAVPSAPPTLLGARYGTVESAHAHVCPYVWAVTATRPTEPWTPGLLAVAGLVASADPSHLDALRAAIQRCAAGVEHRVEVGSPLLRDAPGWLLRGPDGVLAHAVTLPPALVAASRVACVGPGGEARRPVVTSISVSQSLLALGSAEPVGSGA